MGIRAALFRVNGGIGGESRLDNEFPIDQARRTGVSIRDQEMIVQLRIGHQVPLSVSAAPCRSASGEITGVQEAAPKLLAAIGVMFEWRLGALWLVDQQAAALRCQYNWRAAGVDVPEFEQVSIGTPMRQEAVMRRRAFLHDMLASVTEGKLMLCDTPAGLPEPPVAVGQPVSLDLCGSLRDLRHLALPGTAWIDPVLCNSLAHFAKISCAI